MHIIHIKNKLKDKIKNIIVKSRINNNNKKINVIYIPGFNAQSDFEDQYLRLIWYINPIIDSVDSIFIPINRSSINTGKKINIPYYLDQSILEFEPNIKHKIKYFDHENSEEWIQNLKNSQISFVWDTEFTYSDNTINNAINTYKKFMQNWRVDHQRVQHESSFYLKFSLEANPNKETDLKKSQQRFNDFIKTIKQKNYKKAYIFGTGPSLDEAFKNENTFDDGLTIACNSMVKNRELLQKLKPKLFVASDPIFHAGCSAYAEEFRKNLFISMDEFPDSILIVPFRDYILYTKNFPKRFSDRIVGIPFEHLENTKFDLITDFRVKSTSNVMTNLLIPLSATIAKEIHMMGYDGRKIENNQYFWEHNKKAQFNDQMESIKVAHPSFFSVDYDDYYFEHCETLEKIFSNGEKKGYKFVNQAHSYIPALVKRRHLKIAVLANCQGGPVKGLIQKHLPNVNFLDIPPVHLLAKDHYHEIHNTLQFVDFIITQPLSNKFDSLCIDNLKEKHINNLIVFPVIYFRGYNPEMIYLKDLNGVSIRDFGIDCHDVFILFGYLNKKSIEEVHSWFKNETFIQKKTVQELWNNSLEELSKKENQCDISVSNIIENNIHSKIFHTVNHPNNLIMDSISKNILKKLGFNGKFDGAKAQLFSNTQIPSYASVKSILGFTAPTTAIANNNKISKKDMIKNYYSFYDTIDREILLHNMQMVDDEIKKILDKA